jgi:exodeoxyribonuclease V alpha subunit
VPGLQLPDDTLRTISRAWKLRTKEEQALLKGTLPRFDLGSEQIETILAPNRLENGITSELKFITQNPYILAEQYVGNDADDIIPWGRIDRGALPSPELGGSNLVDLDDPKRMRALAIQCLKRDAKHTFLPAPYLTQQINARISILPDYKRHTFTERYWEVDAEFLSEALHLRTNDDNLFVYLISNHEDERLIENELKFLIGGPDIKLTRPVTETTWTDYLFAADSVLAEKAVKAYRVAIKGQVKACQRVFVRPLTVLAGAAGTGKTTVIKSIIKAIKKGHGVGTSVIALAPTGKAADRIREILEKDTSLNGSVETASHHRIANVDRGALCGNLLLPANARRAVTGNHVGCALHCCLLVGDRCPGSGVRGVEPTHRVPFAYTLPVGRAQLAALPIPGRQ